MALSTLAPAWETGAPTPGADAEPTRDYVPVVGSWPLGTFDPGELPGQIRGSAGNIGESYGVGNYGGVETLWSGDMTLVAQQTRTLTAGAADARHQFTLDREADVRVDLLYSATGNAELVRVTAAGEERVDSMTFTGIGGTMAQVTGAFPGQDAWNGGLDCPALAPGTYRIVVSPPSSGSLTYTLAVTGSEPALFLQRRNTFSWPGWPGRYETDQVLNEFWNHGECEGAVQFSPTGELGMLLRAGNEYIFCRRGVPGGWHGETIPGSLWWRYWGHDTLGISSLVYEADGTANFFRSDHGQLIRHRRGPDGWQEQEILALDPGTAANFFTFPAMRDASGALHLLVGSTHVTNRTGDWTQESLPFAFYLLETGDTAIGPDGSIHFAEFRRSDSSSGYANQVRYWTNRTGQWTSEVVYTGNTSTDNFEAVSIAVRPDGQPAIASHLVRRVSTGSALSSCMGFAQRQANGTWICSSPVTVADGYVGRDGAQYTGAQPELAFDAQGRPNIVFTDHASSHFTHAYETKGQIRHARWTGSRWEIRTVYAQHNTIHQQVIDPTIALGPDGQVAIAGLAEEFLPGPGNAYRFASRTLVLTTEGFVDVGDLGKVELESYENLPAGNDRYRFQTTLQGTLTLQATYRGPGPSDRLTLLDRNGSVLVSVAPSGTVARIDRQVDAGETYFVQLTGVSTEVHLRLVNRVSWTASSVNIWGTGGTDQFTFEAGSASHRITIDGISYVRPAVSGMTIEFGAGMGGDSVTISGTSGPEQAWLGPHFAKCAGAGFTVTASGASRITVYSGGGDDSASLYDSADADTFSAWPTHARLEGDGFRNDVQGFKTVRAYATAADAPGLDRANLYDSIASDRFYAYPAYAYLTGPGFYNLAKGFDKVYAYATAASAAGVVDQAYLFDSTASDRFYAYPTYAYLTGPGFYNLAKGFDKVYTYATAAGAAGTVDRAYLFDSTGDDVLTLKDDHACLQDLARSFYYWARGFDRVIANGSAGGGNRLTKIEPLDFVLQTTGTWRTS